MGFNSTLPAGLMPETDVDGMREFLSMVITPRVPKSMDIHIYVSQAVVWLCMLTVFAIIIRRLLNGSAWCFQIYHTPRGAFIIPNAVMSLAVCLLIYILLCNALGLIAVKFYRQGYRHNWLLYRDLTAFPAWLAGWFSGAGTLGSFPDALRLRGKVGMFQRFVLNPVLFHVVLFGGPVLCFITVLIPSVLGNHVFNQVPAMHELWLARAADSSADVAELAAGARAIWLALTRAYWFESICFAIWFGWTCFLGILMGIIAVHVLLRVRAQVALAKRKTDSLERSQSTFYLFSSRPNYGNVTRAPTPAIAAGESNTTVATEGSQSCKDLISEDMRQDSPPPPEAVETFQTETNSVVFPALRVTPGEKLTRAEAVLRRAKALKLVYRNLLLQYTALAGGVCGLGGNALLLTLTMYKTAREVTSMGVFHQGETLIVCYINLICVSVVIGAIGWRSFDTKFILGAEADVQDVDLPLAQTYGTPTPFTSRCPAPCPTPAGTTDSPFSRLANSARRNSTVDLGPIN